ncbi:formate/nitrite transporter [Cohnella kolymensis]|uniref:Formate/nitrite transporter n=1 Tax=Cohnella kolymensis TaxID=1590652 RepID=A0ABR5A7U0_9BACL|nr:formate/nitrite transporter family protein [Cohnella kolymensis]KIL37125.1 formate/nitrite transporter [Cohnella kolymensis]
MGYNPPQKVAEIAIEAGARKSRLPLSTMLVLGFLSGAFIALGFLLDVRVSGHMPVEWGSFAGFLGAAVFPLGLILSIIAGGELLTGNMMAVSFAKFAGRVTWGGLLYNWIVITVANFIGAVFIAYMFGHVVGLTAEGPYLDKTVAIAEAKIGENFVQAFVSGIGCNWLVGLAVWLSYSAEDVAGKILGIWFCIMGFVAVGFQHVVANMFIIPAAIFEGEATWAEWFTNFVPVFLGNAVGGAIMVSLFYWIAYVKAAK